jgi:hypothetical protein
MLFQNQSAIEYLLSQMEIVRGLGEPSQQQNIADLEMFQLVTENAIVSLTYQDTLPDDDIKEMVQINKALRNVYSGWVEGRRRARASFGKDAGDLMPFQNRFVPAAGLKNISDREWDRMVSKALESARNAPPPF